jgi:hypothetical protein
MELFIATGVRTADPATKTVEYQEEEDIVAYRGMRLILIRHLRFCTIGKQLCLFSDK